MKLPAGPGSPAPDARDAVADATSTCRAVSTITAEITAAGSVGGQRFRARLSAGLAPPASARLEAAAPFGAPMFILVANGNDATLLLPHDGRVLEHGRPEAVLEALAGVPLDASGLRAALTGCAVTPAIDGAKRLADDWRMVPDGSTEIYLHHENQPDHWRLVATVFHPAKDGDDWRAEYRDFQGGLPRSVRFVANKSDRFDLRLTLSQVDVNTPLPREVFRVEVPRDADPITIDELKRARPGIRKD
jgi:outer membrane lipoprotein-sorting protein